MSRELPPPVISSEGASFPFSRGLLTKSLAASGLPLAEAYGFACQIQEDLAGRGMTELSKKELMEAVASRLKENYGQAIADRYLRLSRGPLQLVVEGTGTSFPFSKGLLAVSIQASGVNAETAFRVGGLVEAELKKTNGSVVSRDEIRERTSHFLSEIAGDEYAQRYLMWRRLKDQSTPVIVLVGGGTGTGKSTIAAELGRFLGFKRATSTDSIRHIMRTLFSDEFVPSLHESSYTAHKSLSVPLPAGVDPVLFAFREQATSICVGVSAMIDRAIREGVNMILDGVHLVPGFLNVAPFRRSAIISWIMSTVSDEASHKARFSSREAGLRNRLARRYLDNFESIRKIQTYVLSLAEEHRIPIVENDDFDKAVASAISTVSDYVMRQSADRAGA